MLGAAMCCHVLCAVVLLCAAYYGLCAAVCVLLFAMCCGVLRGVVCSVLRAAACCVLCTAVLGAVCRCLLRATERSVLLCAMWCSLLCFDIVNLKECVHPHHPDPSLTKGQLKLPLPTPTTAGHAGSMGAIKIPMLDFRSNCALWALNAELNMRTCPMRSNAPQHDQRGPKERRVEPKGVPTGAKGA